MQMAREQITIETSDGQCPVHVFTSSHAGESPAILLYMDAGGIRPAILAMAERLSGAGYLVLVPDLFYRYGAYGPFDTQEVMPADMMAVLGPLIATTGNAKAAQDTGSVLEYLDTRADVESDRVGAVGFCMGGGMAIASAGSFPSRISVVASFHGGNLATEADDSPHLYAEKLQAELYIAAAEDDEFYPSSMARRFEAALERFDVSHKAETYPAAHGWMVPDFPTFNESAADKGWRNMLAFFKNSL
jgi:carboxymethylenebutenolidase